MYNSCDLVLIEWEDSRQPDAPWTRLADYILPQSCKCVSVGFLIKDDDREKILAPNMADIESEENIQASGMICIPSSCVTKVTKLEEEVKIL